MSSVDELIDTLKKLENYEEAGSALRNLKLLSPELAKDIAYEILNEKKGDVFLQSFAFSILYSIDKYSAFSFIKREFLVLEPDVLIAAIESATEDSSLYNGTPEMHNIVFLLNERIKTLDIADLQKYDYSISWFKKSFSSILKGYDNTDVRC